MRNLYRSLDLLEKKLEMDYELYFNEIKSVLEHCNRNVKSFNTIQFRGGNVPVINEISSRLHDVFVEHNWLDENGVPLPEASDDLRKVLLFLIANTDVAYKYSLRDDIEIAHLVEICPLLPKFLFPSLIWNLKMATLFFEILSFSPSWFSFQHFESATSTLKYIDDAYEILEHVEGLLRATCICISRIGMHEIDFVDRKIIFDKLYDNAMDILRIFYVPDADKTNKFSTRESYKFLGFTIMHIMQIILFAFDLYESSDTNTQSSDIKMYNLCSTLCKKTEPNNETTKAIKEQLLRIIQGLLNSLQYNVMLVKLDMFMEWVEVDIPKKGTLQRVNGEMAYHIGLRTAANDSFKHDISSQLITIVVKPQIYEMDKLTFGEILRHLDDPLWEDKKKLCIEELISRQSALGNSECLEALNANCNYISVSNCKAIMDFIILEGDRILEEHSDLKIEREQLMTDDRFEDYHELNNLIVKCLNNYTAKELIDLLNYQIEKFGNKTTQFCMANFQNRMTEFLNNYKKIKYLTGFLKLCFENSNNMWSQFIKIAVESKSHNKIFCDTVLASQPYSTPFFESVFNHTLTDFYSLMETNFSKLFCKIFYSLFYSERKTEFVEIVMKHIDTAIENDEFHAASFLIEGLRDIILHKSNKNMENCFGIAFTGLFMKVVSIMDKSRWDLLNYSNGRSDLINICVSFINNTNTFTIESSPEVTSWLNNLMGGTTETRYITQYYLQRLTVPEGETHMDFTSFLMNKSHPKDCDLETFVLVHFVRCTLKEAVLFVSNYNLADYLNDVMMILASIVNHKLEDGSIKFFNFCMSSYGNIVRKNLIPIAESNEKKLLKLIFSFLKVLNESPKELYDELFLRFEPMLVEMIEKIPTKSYVDRITKFLIEMPRCEAKKILLAGMENNSE